MIPFSENGSPSNAPPELKTKQEVTRRTKASSMKTRGIALHSIRYSESGNIVAVYTEEFGRRSYMVHGGSRKSSKKMPLFQPLTLLMLEVDHKPNREIQRIREANVLTPLAEIHTNMPKTTIALFCAEILYRTIREEESNPTLFSFLHHSIQMLDLLQKGTENFHLAFMMQLSKYLGFFPAGNFSPLKNGFNFHTGSFEPVQPGQTLDAVSSELINRFLSVSYTDLHNIELSGTQRSNLLEKMVQFFQFHIEGLGAIKSLKILQEVFA